jgi:PncC family amidohydrolase
MSESVEARLGRLLTERGWKLAVAETTTGGLICSRIVAVPGSSRFLDRGVVAYSPEAKIQMLGVSEDLLREHGAVSGEVASALAEGVRDLSGATFGLAETGIAGPVQGRSHKPVGTAFVALASPQGTRYESLAFTGSRQQIREAIAEAALSLCLNHAEQMAL